jgi:asparagine synthase (glutamine-hydrolysing)
MRFRRKFERYPAAPRRRLQNSGLVSRVKRLVIVENRRSDHPLSLVQYLDMKTYLVGDINTKVDRASMAHSLEVREPLMDHPLVEWLATLPSSLKLRGQEGKYLLKKAMEPHLPHEILYRPKMGFAVPLARWFRGPLRARVRRSLLGERLLGTELFNARYLRTIVEQHESGARDYSAAIWTLLMFDAFLGQASTSRLEPAIEHAA